MLTGARSIVGDHRNRNSKYNSSSLVRFLSKKLGRTFNKKAGFRGRAFLPNDQVGAAGLPSKAPPLVTDARSPRSNERETVRLPVDPSGCAGSLLLTPSSRASVLQHQLILDVLDGRLFLCPAKPKRVLDVGTGPGLWCLVRVSPPRVQWLAALASRPSGYRILCTDLATCRKLASTPPPVP